MVIRGKQQLPAGVIGVDLVGVTHDENSDAAPNTREIRASAALSFPQTNGRNGRAALLVNAVAQSYGLQLRAPRQTQPTGDLAHLARLARRQRVVPLR